MLPFALLTALLAPTVLFSATASDWFGDNAQKIQSFLATYGKNSRTYDARHKPVAALDWDNTMIKNDIGDATFFWMIAHGKLHAPKNWKSISPYLEPAAAAELEKNCPPKAGLLPSAESPACAEALLAVYDSETLLDGKTPAWKRAADPDLLKPAYGFYAALFQGYTAAEVRDFTRQALAFNLKNPLGEKRKLGNRQVNASIRVYPAMRALVGQLKAAGMEVWVISASLQPTVEVAAEQVGIAPDHVIGIRPTEDAHGRFTDRFQGCGTYPDGTADLITYRKGKRCWLQRVVFGEKDPAAMLEKPVPLAFAAGDSETDFFFLSDARGLRLVIHRDKPELACHAYFNADGKWILNPMFFQPLGKKADGFHCAVYGLPDQPDRVFGNYP